MSGLLGRLPLDERGLVRLFVFGAHRALRDQSSHALGGRCDMAPISLLEVLDCARVLVAIEPADTQIAEAHSVDDRRHEAILEGVEGALDIGVPRRQIFEQLAESCVVQRSTEPVQIGQPAERAGVGAQRPQTPIYLGSRAVDCIDAE